MKQRDRIIASFESKEWYVHCEDMRIKGYSAEQIEAEKTFLLSLADTVDAGILLSCDAQMVYIVWLGGKAATYNDKQKAAQKMMSQGQMPEELDGMPLLAQGNA